jgi:NADH dehydrogenase I D subunit
MSQAILETLVQNFWAQVDDSHVDPIPCVWVEPTQLLAALSFLKQQAQPRFELLYDIAAIDEAGRGGGFTLYYQLLSLSGNADFRLKIHLDNDQVAVPSAVSVWSNANWYEREIYDLFGLRFADHPDLRRILMPVYWQGHPLLKSYPSRATEVEPFSLPEQRYQEIMAAYQAEEAQMSGGKDDEFVLNIGPNHPGTHGILRFVVRLEGEIIRGIDPDIGYHHRGAEKIAERHTYHNYIPYTDRVEYLAGVAVELPYILAVEKLAGIDDVPERATVMRVMLSEMFRVCSHLVWLGSFAHDLGSMGPAFYTFREREYVFDVVEKITGGRMHPAFFRIGGVALDLPEGWQADIDYMAKRVEAALPEYEALMVDNLIFQTRTKGVGKFNLQQAIEWGYSGPNLRACGLDWDLRKKRPYCGYEHYDFEVPTATQGDALTRTRLRIEEIRQSLKIIRQAAKRMPGGPVLSSKARYAMPRKEQTLADIETLIHHFISSSHGMGFPAGESFYGIEAPKGMMGYHVISDGSSNPYRVRIRTPSFAHVQAIPHIAKNKMISDLIAILGSIDFVLADIDR